MGTMTKWGVDMHGGAGLRQRGGFMLYGLFAWHDGFEDYACMHVWGGGGCVHVCCLLFAGCWARGVMVCPTHMHTRCGPPWPADFRV